MAAFKPQAACVVNQNNLRTAQHHHSTPIGATRSYPPYQKPRGQPSVAYSRHSCPEKFTWFGTSTCCFSARCWDSMSRKYLKRVIRIRDKRGGRGRSIREVHSSHKEKSCQSMPKPVSQKSVCSGNIYILFILCSICYIPA